MRNIMRKAKTINPQHNNDVDNKNNNKMSTKNNNSSFRNFFIDHTFPNYKNKQEPAGTGIAAKI